MTGEVKIGERVWTEEEWQMIGTGKSHWILGEGCTREQVLGGFLGMAAMVQYRVQSANSGFGVLVMHQRLKPKCRRKTVRTVLSRNLFQRLDEALAWANEELKRRA